MLISMITFAFMTGALCSIITNYDEANAKL